MGLLSPEVQALYETDPAVKQYLDAMAAQQSLQTAAASGVDFNDPATKAYWDAMAQNPEFAAQQAANATQTQQQLLWAQRALDAVKSGAPEWYITAVGSGVDFSDPETKKFWDSMAANPALADYFAKQAAGQSPFNQGSSGYPGDNGSTGNAPIYGSNTTGNVINGVNRGAPVGVGNVANIPLPKNFAETTLGPANDAAAMLALGQQPAFSAARMRGLSPMMNRYLSPEQSSYWQLASQFAQAPYANKPWGNMPWGQMPINNATGQMNFAPQGTGNSFNAAMNVVGPMLPQQPTMTSFPGWQAQFPGWAEGANLGLGS